MLTGVVKTLPPKWVDSRKMTTAVTQPHAPRPTRPAPASRVRSLVAKVVDGVATPLVTGDYLDMLAPLRAGGQLVGRVVEVRPESADATTIVLRPGRGWRAHQPGQYARVGVEVDGVRLWRTYSITSAPADGTDRSPALSFTVQAITGGAVSRRLQAVDVGQLLYLDQADGDFTAPESVRAGRVLFVTAGSGITPVLGLLRSGRFADAVLVHSARTADDVLFGAELRALAAAGRMRLIERHTATDGRLDADDLTALVPDATDREVYVCGPAGLVSEIDNAWTAWGLADRVRTEQFHTPITVTGSGGRVTFTKSGKIVENDSATSLLVDGEEAGALLPFGCRQGICFRCVLPLTSGSVRDLRTGEVTTAVAGDGVSVQTCISGAAGDCTIDG